MDTEEKPRGGRQRWEGGGHQPRDGRPEPPEAGRSRKDPPLEPLQGAWPWDPCRATGLQGWGAGDGCLLSLVLQFVALCQDSPGHPPSY